ncbi:MAG: hypothetical protein HYR72_17955 [Deltaproteobacteria bacterium]|nr:hypothetical protein [Deltaproteobacteria bacterium]MBI3386396.1 hypothetical protein [Deltaproteobacteria bacterium]
MNPRGVELSQLRRVVGLTSIAYIALPVALWMLGWLAPLFALIGIAALCTGTGLLASQIAASARRDKDGRRISRWEIAAVSIVVCIVIGLTGAGGFGVQTDDWLKHNAILSDLINQPWPVAYRTSAGPIALVYYVAYYLPAALVGKLCGWTAANLVLYGWTVLGGVLTVLWLVVLSRAPVWLCLLGFTFFSGLDAIGGWLRAAVSGAETWTSWTNNLQLEWWEGHWIIPGNLSLIAYVPQQALGGWLLTCLMIDGLRERTNRLPCVLIVALALMWSPYVAIGLGVLSVLSIVASGARIRTLAAGQLSLANLSGVIVGVICAVYFAARSAPVALADAYVSPPSAFERGAFAVGLHEMPPLKFALHYASSMLLEFGMLASLLALVYRRRPGERQILVASTVTLLALPFFHHGHFNDLVMRVSIPPLFALLVLTLTALATAPSRAIRFSLIALLTIGALHPATRLRINALTVARRGSVFQLSPVVSLFEMQLKVRDHWPYLYQYICPLDSFFFNHMARQAIPIDRDP